LRRVPTVLRSGPCRFFFYASDEREPAHVHVQRDRKRAKLWLMPVRVDWNTGFGPAEPRQIARLVADNEEILLRRWHEFFES
jgi:hypothetical protein